MTYLNLPSGTWVGKAHHMVEVISNLKQNSDYYKNAILPFTIKDNHPLREQYKQQGQFSLFICK